jgi:hypothetical protein
MMIKKDLLFIPFVFQGEKSDFHGGSSFDLRLSGSKPKTGFKSPIKFPAEKVNSA